MVINVAVLPGDGIGPEVTTAAVEILNVAADLHGIALQCAAWPFGGVAFDQYGTSFPAKTLDAVMNAHAILLGAVGGPNWNNLPREQRPETALLALRQHLGAFANLRPASAISGLEDRSLLRAEIVRGADVLIVRELAGGIYFGEPRGLDENEAWNTMRYARHEVERIAAIAFSAASKRRGRVAHVDKANVLECSEFFRKVVEDVAGRFPNVELEHIYVDAAALRLIARPSSFDVILTENLFGDILSDVAAALPGSLGVLPSASLGNGPPLFEPVHGSAPDICGKGIANPTGAILAAAMLLEYAAGAPNAAQRVRAAVHAAMQNHRTHDFGGTATTTEFTNAAKHELLQVASSTAWA